MDEVLPLEFLDVLRLSLKSSADILLTLEERPLGPSPGHIREIIEAILWHRKFLLTYYAAIAIVVTICSAHGLYQKLALRGRWQRERKHEDAPDTSLSSSSTLRGTVTPPQKDDAGESTPLLRRLPPSARERPSLLARVKGLLMHQPRPIRALTTHRNVLPDNGTTLIVLSFLALNLFYLLYRVPLSETGVIILADRAGLLFVVDLPLLYLLAAKTNQPIKALTGWSYEGLNLFHRRLGEWMICFAVIHMLGMFATWYAILRPLGYTLLRYLTTRVVFLGISAFLSYFIIYVTSIGWFRYLYYEAFLGLHIFFQVAALAFLFFHYPTAKPSLRDKSTKEGAWDKVPSSPWLASRATCLPPIPSMGFKYRFQTHPFTISSPAPPKDNTVASWPLQLVIRSIDGFSHDLLKFARHHQHCEVMLDGPHGGTEALEAARRADRACFVAGGSGIAVTYPLAWDVLVKDELQANALVSSRAVYANGIRRVPAITDCGPITRPFRYAHFWVRQDPLHRKWISMFPRADTVQGGHPGNEYGKDITGEDGNEVLASIITHTFDTRRSGPDGGRPDMQAEVWNWVTSVPASLSSTPSTSLDQSPGPVTACPSDLKESQETINQPHDEKVAIVVSGPDGLVRDVRNVAARLVQDGWNVDVWVEKFGW